MYFLKDCFLSADDVFLEVEPIIRSALDGHNVCIFAYGQTGTGKTFTMVSDCLRVPFTLPSFVWYYVHFCVSKPTLHQTSLHFVKVSYLSLGSFC